MWLVGFRDLVWRRRRFFIATLVAAVVFSITLLLAGLTASFQNETRTLLHEDINGATTTANVLIGVSVAAMIIAVVELARLTADASRPEPTIDLTGIERAESRPARTHERA